MSVIDLSAKLQETQEDYVKQLYNPIEAGELANEAGKSYIKQLNKSIENNVKLGLDKIFIIVITKKDPKVNRMIKITFGICDKPLKFKRENADLWEYNYKTSKLKLHWSLPHRTEMKNFLRSPEKYDKEIIKWIREYVAQENIDLTDKSSQIVS